MEQHQRTLRLIGANAHARLQESRVAVFGIGGVGGFAAEALIRAGVGTLLFVDGDCVDITNVNRQIIATHETVGLPKVDVMKKRALSINPDIKIDARRVFFDAETVTQFDFTQYDYVVDAIDSVTSKILLIERAVQAGTPIISAMGAGNKLDPARFRVEDIAKTSVCPLARVMRRELKKRGIEHLKVVFSDELPLKALDGDRSPGSISFVPSAAGLVLAGAVVRDLIGAVV